MSFRTKTLVILALLLLAGVLGYQAYAKLQRDELRADVVVILQDVSPRMREALTLEASLPAVGRLGTGDQLEQHAAAVDHRLQQLKNMDGTPDLRLVDAADSYALTVREILRKQASSNRSRQSLSESMDALRKHMQSDNRTGAWVQEAVVAKEKVDKDYRDYRISADAFNTVLGTLTDAQTKIAPHVDASLLSDIQLISEVRNQTLKALSGAAAEIEKIKQLESHR